MGSWQHAGRMLRGLRENRGWEVPKLAAELKAKATAIGQAVPDRQSLVRMIYEWEAGTHRPRAYYAVRPGLCDRGGTGHAYHQAWVRAISPDGSLESDGSAGEPATSSSSTPQPSPVVSPACRRSLPTLKVRSGLSGCSSTHAASTAHRRVPARTDLGPHEATRGRGVAHLATLPSGRAAGADHAAA